MEMLLVSQISLSFWCVQLCIIFLLGYKNTPKKSSTENILACFQQENSYTINKLAIKLGNIGHRKSIHFFLNWNDILLQIHIVEKNVIVYCNSFFVSPFPFKIWICISVSNKVWMFDNSFSVNQCHSWNSEYHIKA